jgi:outer membrane biogenesis lipoprotein LolB
MNKKQLIVAGVVVLLLSGCTLIQDKSKQNDSGNVRVSGDATISTVDRKGF